MWVLDYLARMRTIGYSAKLSWENVVEFRVAGDGVTLHSVDKSASSLCGWRQLSTVYDRRKQVVAHKPDSQGALDAGQLL